MSGKSASRKWLTSFKTDRWDYMVTVVDFMSLHQADEAFEAWLDGAGFSRDAIPPEHLVIDDEPGDRGRLRRYRVHRDHLPQP